MPRAAKYPIFITLEVLLAFTPVFLYWAAGSIAFAGYLPSMIFTGWDLTGALISSLFISGGIGLLGLLKLVKLVLLPSEPNWTLRTIFVCFIFGLTALGIVTFMTRFWFFILPVFVSAHLFYIAVQKGD